ncbi:MAG: DUF6807 family protein [Pirellulales bacterium]
MKTYPVWLMVLALAVMISYTAESRCFGNDEKTDLRADLQDDRLLIFCGSQLVAEYVYRDPHILRPYFSNVHTPSGIRVTRNHPPIEGQDQMDHATMHPGIWIGFGNVNGEDFWRNKGKIQHEKFLSNPVIMDGSLEFATTSTLIGNSDSKIGTMNCRFHISKLKSGIRFIWIVDFPVKASKQNGSEPTITFGDQEEMGFGIRVATPLTEKNGGRIRSSKGVETAKSTWGQSADWCDYSGKMDDREVGITVLCEFTKERPTWWHNRDYGLMVANAFGRAAMKQGPVQSTIVEPGRSLVLKYGIVIHEGSEYSPSQEYKAFSENLQSLRLFENP